MRRNTLIEKMSNLAISLVTVLMALILPVAAQAQIYVNPGGPSTGGNSGTVLDTSSNAQEKLGSLLIGQTGAAPARLCLNGTGNLTGADDATAATPGGHCITSWANVANAIGGPFVNLVTTNPTGNSTLITSYAPPQLGYVRLKGSGTGSPITFQTDANNAVGATSPTAALYASSALVEDYSGYFSGKLNIEPSENGGVQISRGRLCLNSTFNSVCVPGDPNYAACQNSVNNGYYCISDWSQIITANITNQLTLQTSVSPSTESGGVRLTQAFNAGAAVIGVPPSSSPNNLTKPFCGDGMCSTEINENQSASPNYCLMDCEIVPVLTAAFVSATQASGGVDLLITPRPVSSTATPYFLVVRSNVSSFSFEPTDGGLQQLGGNANFAVVYAGTHASATAFHVIDAGYGIVPGQPYTYRIYEGNAYPRFNKVAPSNGLNYYQVTVTAGSNGGGTIDDPGCTTNCDPPIIRGGH